MAKFQNVKVGRIAVEVKTYPDLMYYKGGWRWGETVEMRTIRKKKGIDKRKAA